MLEQDVTKRRDVCRETRCLKLRHKACGRTLSAQIWDAGVESDLHRQLEMRLRKDPQLLENDS